MAILLTINPIPISYFDHRNLVDDMSIHGPGVGEPFDSSIDFRDSLPISGLDACMVSNSASAWGNNENCLD
jgi:hypothetical protein